MAADWKFTKVKQPKATEICSDIDLTEPGQALLKHEQPPAEFLGALLDQSLYVDAVRFLARALPKREAVWWACLCARESLTIKASPKNLAAVEKAERWVYQPTEENRRAAMAAAELTKLDGAGGWAAMAAFWSGGSMASPDAPVVLPADNLSSKAVASAVMLAAVAGPPEGIVPAYQLFIRQGINIAEGGNGRLESA